MKKLFISIAIAMLCHASLQAQDIPFKIKMSDVFKDEYKYSTIMSVEEDGNGGLIIVRSFRGGAFSSAFGYYFEHYDSEMKLIKEFEYDSKRSGVMGIIVNEDKVNIIDFTYEKDRKAFVCNSNTASINDFNFSKKELFTLPSEEVGGFSFFSSGGNQDSDTGAQMIVNEDKSAFSIIVDISNKNQETHKLYLYDSKLNQKFIHEFKRDIKDRKFRYENIDVSKDGNTLYLLGKVYSTEKKKKKEGGKYQYELSRIDKDGIATQVFDTEEHFSGSLKTIVFNDRVSCVGFYSDRNDSRYKGLSYFEMDPKTLAINKSKFNPFTEQFMIDKYGKDKDKELRNLSFRGISITAAGDIVFNAEEYYEITSTMMQPGGGMYTRTTYYYNDIVSAKLNRSGDLIWARNINKRQSTSGDDSYISYTSTIKGDDTFFFINTGEKVKKLSNDRIQFGQTSPKRSNLNIIRIKPNGDFDYQEILDDKDSEVPFMVSDGAVTNNSVYFIGRKGKKKQLLKVTL